MNIKNIDLTDEVFNNYESSEDVTTLHFAKITIKLDGQQFKKLKDTILLNEELDEAYRCFKIKTDKPLRETILKELMKTIDKIEALDKESDELYEKEFGALVVEKPYPSQKEIFELKLKGHHLIRKMGSLKYYKEKLEAQLKYGELR